MDPMADASKHNDEFAGDTGDLKLFGHVYCDRTIVAACQKATTVEDIFKVFMDRQIEHKKKIWSIRYGVTEYVFTRPEQFPLKLRDEIIGEISEYASGYNATHPPPKRFKVDRGYYRKIDGVNVDSEVVTTCEEAAKPISLETAKKVWDQLIDYEKITDAECWTLRYVLTEFNWSEEAFFWIFSQFPERPEKGLPGKNAGVDLSPPKKLIDRLPSFIPQTDTSPTPASEFMPKWQLFALLLVVLLLIISIWRRWPVSILFTILVLIFATAKLDAKIWPDWARWWL